MKLKTRIILISTIAVLAAVLLSEITLFSFIRKSYIEEAVQSAAEDYRQILADYSESAGYVNNAELKENHIQFFFKQLNDSGCVAFIGKKDLFGNIRNYEEAYNHTVFTFDQLRNMQFSESSLGCAYTFHEYGGAKFAVFSGVQETESDIVYIYRIADISYVWARLRLLVLGMAAVLLVLLGLTTAAIAVSMNKVLRPLGELNAGAQRIADGHYEHRIDVSTQDEIGQLGNSFNKMVEAVEQHTRSLQDSEQKKTLFMGDLTHELKTPVTAISGYAQLLLTAKLSEERKEEALMYIHEECGRLERLSRKLMQLLELDRDGTLDFTEVTAGRLFDAVARACHRLLEDKGITLVCRGGEHLFRVEEDLMTDALINLVDNAVKASETGSEVILEATEDTISVRDFGMGIPKAEQDRILEPFYMIDKSRSRKSGGAGLGLSLTAAIIRKHNCRLVIESEENKGTTMILHFV